MKISTKGRYALRMLIDLAEHMGDGFIPLKDISARQGISKNYMEQIMPLLSKSGMLKTSRGFQGGYKLASAPSNYTVGSILKLTEGSISPVSCLEENADECLQAPTCCTLEVWRGLGEVITNYLESITLQDILDKQESLGEPEYII